MLRDTLSRIAADADGAMTVVTFRAAEGPVGCLVGFSTQASIRPWRYTVHISELNHTAAAARLGASAAVHFLSREQLALARLFGEQTQDEIDKFARCRWTRGPEDTVILTDVCRWIAGPVVARCQPGDHLAVTMEPVAATAGDWPGPLSFQQVRDFVAGHPAH